MWLPVAVLYVGSLLLSVWGIQHYINVFKHPVFFSVPIILAVFIPISIILLLPLDYVQHHPIDAKKPWQLLHLPENVILYLWKAKYWTTFLLTWLIIPILQEFYRSGQFRGYNRIMDALKKNLRFQLIILAVSVIGVIYLGLEVGLSFGHMKSMIISLSHIYSLILALWLMAHGLINIPRNKWTFGSVVGKLNHQYLQVPKLIDDLEDCKISFKEDILQVLVLQKNFTTNVNDAELFVFRDWILSLYDKIPGDLKEVIELQYLSESPTISRSQLTNEFMTKLTARFNSNHFKLIAYESAFVKLFEEIVLLEDVANSTRASAQFRMSGGQQLLSPGSRFVWHRYVVPVFNRVYSIVLFGCSFVIIESEFFHSTKLSIINVVFNKINHNFTRFLTCSVAFSVMLIASLNSLTKLKIFNMYHLVPHKSDPVSACFYATYIARLTIPLSYNFITLFINRDSTYENWFGKSIHLTGLFNLMNNWIPRLILLPIVLTVFNVYDKLKRRIGLSSDLYDTFGFDDEQDDPEALNHKRKDMIIVEAKRIINREYSKRQAAGSLRPFNLSQAADMNYDANRRAFEESLGSNMDNRIDQEIQAEVYEPRGSVWSQIGSQWTNLKGVVASRFRRGSSSSNGGFEAYRDEPLDEFAYDTDADNDNENDRLVL